MLSEILITIASGISEINPLIPYYHVVSNEKLPHLRHLYPYKNISQFLKDLDYLGRTFKPIELSDLLDFIKRGKNLKKRSLFITFDDGYSECYSIVAPILYKKGIPAAFFVCPKFIDNKEMYYKNKTSLIINDLINRKGKDIENLPFFENRSLIESIDMVLRIRYRNRHILDEIANIIGIDWNYYLKAKQPYLTSQQITEMINMGFSFGAHSLDHANFEDLTIEEQLFQAKSSIDFIKKRFNTNYSIFAFPFSDRNISLEFFIKTKDYIDISFGTSGVKIDMIRSNLERIDFETSNIPLKRLYAKKLIKNSIYLALGKRCIIRN